MNPNRNTALKVGLFSSVDPATLAMIGIRADERDRRTLREARARRVESDPLLDALAEAAVYGWSLDA